MSDVYRFQQWKYPTSLKAFSDIPLSRFDNFVPKIETLGRGVNAKRMAHRGGSFIVIQDRIRTRDKLRRKR